MIYLLSLFSGIGAFEKALKRLKIPFELINYCEIDKYASKAYSLIHGEPESKNARDVTQIDCQNIPFGVDFLTYGFPCQDISSAGLQKGFSDENGNRTRSGLFFNALDVIEKTRPKIAIAENVKALTSKRFSDEFKTVLDGLTAAGYTNYYKVLNAKDYGIPQNRDRVFIVSIRNDINRGFQFPAPFPLDCCLRDFLEPVVDECFFLSDSKLNFILNNGLKNKIQNGRIDSDSLRIPEPTAAGYKTAAVGDCVNVGFPNSKTRRGRVTSGMSAALITFNQLGVVVYDDYNSRVRGDQTTVGTITTNVGNDAPRNGQKLIVCNDETKFPVAYDEQNGYLRKDGCVGTITTGGSSPKHNNRVVTSDLRIRKFTPKECFRLMDFDDADFEILAQNGISNAQLYKLAGNSIVVRVLECLFLEIFKQYGDVFKSGQQIGFYDMLGE